MYISIYKHMHVCVHVHISMYENANAFNDLGSRVTLYTNEREHIL